MNIQTDAQILHSPLTTEFKVVDSAPAVSVVKVVICAEVLVVVSDPL